MCSGSSLLHIFRCRILPQTLITSTTNVRFLPCILSVDGPVFSPTTSCTGHLKRRSSLKNICCSEGTYVHRTDICDRLGFVFLGLFARADGPLFSGLAASLRPHSAPQGHLSIRSCTCSPPPRLYSFLLPRLLNVPLYIPLSFLPRSLPARLPDGAALGYCHSPLPLISEGLAYCIQSWETAPSLLAFDWLNAVIRRFELMEWGTFLVLNMFNFSLFEFSNTKRTSWKRVHAVCICRLRRVN